MLVAGCSPTLQRVEPEVEYREVPVAVATGCISGEGRPAKGQTLKQQYSAAQWRAKPVGAKAEAVKARAGERMNYADALESATSGCK
jgi:hypothetical protein